MATVSDAVAARRLADEPAPSSLWEFVEESGLRPLLVGVSKDLNAKVTLILVSPSTGLPVVVVKAPTTRKAALAVETEWRLLDELQIRVRGRLRKTLPSPVRVVEFEGRPAMVATAVDGIPMTVSYFGRRHTADRSRVAADLRAAGTWLAKVQRATEDEHAPIDIALGLARQLERRFGAEESPGDVADRLAEIDARLRSATTPRTAVHGDFWFGNVLLRGGDVSGVVDWESGVLTGEPVRDLSRFALSYALYLDRRTRGGRVVTGHTGLRADRWGAAIEFALNGSGWFPEEFKNFLQSGLLRLGAPPGVWREVALAGIAELAARSDDDEFAAQHLALFRRLTRGLSGSSKS